MSDKWGFGDPAKARPFGGSFLGEEERRPIELLLGEHPHSRSDDKVYARDEHGAIYEFDGHRVLIDVSIRSYNYLKESYYSGDQIRKGVSCQISADNEPIYNFFSRDPSYALLRAHHLITELGEHSSGVITAYGRKELIGRKVWYERTPAIVTRFLGDQGCVILNPEPGHKFERPVWANEPDDDWEYEDGLKDDILSPKIWWFREG